jgi:hypothetical protein
MTEFQRIAIGLLGLTHPEVFISISNRTAKATAASGSAGAHSPGAVAVLSKLKSLKGRAERSARDLRFLLYALGAGSRTAPLGDNGHLVRELAMHAASLYGPERRK